MKKDKEKRRSSLTFGEKMLFIAGILLCLVLITTAMMGGLFARYVASDTGQDSARVAKFGNLTLTETGDFVNQKGMIIPGVDLKKEVKVSFTGSEMATYLFVKIDAHDWDWNGGYDFSRGTNMTWSVDLQWQLVSNSSSVYYMEVLPNTPVNDANVIAVLGENNENHIRVAKDIDKNAIEQLKTQNLNINIQASVIQSGGFDSVAEAWAYLNP